MSERKPDARDFATPQEVRWCPGCGDYAVLKCVRQALADIGAERHRTAFVSGIGCAARFPYYMNTYGFHTIHGRAPAIATGLKAARPELDVWVVTGDGDGLSIGVGHLFHALRRNVDLQILLFNNQVYGLTKGQASPTSRPGQRTVSTPGGVTDAPAEPCVFALSAGGRFVARAIDVQQRRLRGLLAEAHAFRGTAFVEILQNCPIYNHGAYDALTDRAAGSDRTLVLAHGQPLRFGPRGERGIRLAPGALRPEVVEIDPDDPRAADGLLRHDERNPLLGAMLAAFEPPDFPVALGVIHRAPAPAFASARAAPMDPAETPAQRADAINALIRRAKTWRVG